MTDWFRLDRIADVRRGTAPANTVDYDEGPGFFGLAEISQGGTITRQPEPGNEPKELVYLRAGDVVVALMNRIGESVTVSDDADGSVLGRECAAIQLRPGERRVLPGWLSIVLRSGANQQRLAGLATGSTMPRLATRHLAALEVPVPPIEEQQAVLDRMKRLQTAIHAQGVLLASLNRLYDAEVALAVPTEQIDQNDAKVTTVTAAGTEAQ